MTRAELAIWCTVFSAIGGYIVSMYQAHYELDAHVFPAMSRLVDATYERGRLAGVSESGGCLVHSRDLLMDRPFPILPTDVAQPLEVTATRAVESKP